VKRARRAGQGWFSGYLVCVVYLVGGEEGEAGLVFLVHLVCFVYRTKETKPTKQTRKDTDPAMNDGVGEGIEV
jgi:hypothetical protein